MKRLNWRTKPDNFLNYFKTKPLQIKDKVLNGQVSKLIKTRIWDRFDLKRIWKTRDQKWQKPNPFLFYLLLLFKNYLKPIKFNGN